MIYKDILTNSANFSNLTHQLLFIKPHLLLKYIYIYIFVIIFAED